MYGRHVGIEECSNYKGKKELIMIQRMINMFISYAANIKLAKFYRINLIWRERTRVFTLSNEEAIK